MIVYITKHKWRFLVPFLCIILFCTVYFDAKNGAGILHLNSNVLNDKNLSILIDNYNKLEESGEYQIAEPTVDKPFALISSKNADDKLVFIYIYMKSLNIFSSDKFEYTSFYKRSTVLSAVYGIEPLGRHDSYFELKSNYVYIWIADYDDGSASSIEHVINEIMSIVNEV